MMIFTDAHTPQPIKAASGSATIQNQSDDWGGG
jgi:hypothetical protein